MSLSLHATCSLPLSLLVLIVCHLLLFPSLEAHNPINNFKTFTLAPGTLNKNVKRFQFQPDSDSGYDFRLSFQPTECQSNGKKNQDLSHTKQQDEIRRLKRTVSNWHGSCVQTKKGWWDYRVCFGSKVTQFHGVDDYILGAKYEILSHDQVRFTDGQTCEASSTLDKRLTTIDLMCGSSFDLVEVEEPETCNYRMVVTSPDLCGSKLTKTYRGSPDASIPKTSSKRESWSFAWEPSKHFTHWNVGGGDLILRRVNQAVSAETNICLGDLNIELIHVDMTQILNVEALYRLKPIPVAKEFQMYSTEDGIVIRTRKGYTGKIDSIRVSISDDA